MSGINILPFEDEAPLFYRVGVEMWAGYRGRKRTRYRFFDFTTMERAKAKAARLRELYGDTAVVSAFAVYPNHEARELRFMECQQSFAGNWPLQARPVQARPVASSPARDRHACEPDGESHASSKEKSVTNKILVDPLYFDLIGCLVSSELGSGLHGIEDFARTYRVNGHPDIAKWALELRDALEEKRWKGRSRPFTVEEIEAEVAEMPPNVTFWFAGGIYWIEKVRRSYVDSRGVTWIEVAATWSEQTEDNDPCNEIIATIPVSAVRIDPIDDEVPA
jgi:hypothetical protein